MLEQNAYAKNNCFKTISVKAFVFYITIHDNITHAITH